MDENPRLFEIFLDIQRGLPRQGPGNDEITLKALSLCTGLPQRPHILDIGCGPGMQTIALAKATMGHITAVDNNGEYLDELEESAQSAGVSKSIEILIQDMNELTFEPESFDLIWAEGSAYIIGFDKALEVWKEILKPGGYIAISELVWLREDPPSEVAEFWGKEYPPMKDIDSNLTTIKKFGYQLIGHFTLPDSAWWDLYYRPLEAKLPRMQEKYAGDEEALSIMNMVRDEIEIRRQFSKWFGYEFFIGRKI